MNDPSTTYTGPLGSTIHVLRADADTIASLATVDWSRHFPRVCLDPVRGLITLMSPSFPHEDLATILDVVVDAAGSLIAGAMKGLRSTRLRGQGEPPAPGWSPIARSTSASGPGIISRPLGRETKRKPPSSSAPHRTWWSRSRSPMPTRARPSGTVRWEYASCGGCTAARAPGSFGRSSSPCIRGNAPRRLEASEVLEGLTPDDVCDAVAGVRVGQTYDERKDAVARIVGRRQRASVRVREDEAEYSAR